MTKEDLVSLGRPTLIALAVETGRWPKTNPPPRLSNTMELVTFLLRCQDEGMVFVKNANGEVNVGPQIVEEPEAAQSEASAPVAASVPRAPTRGRRRAAAAEPIAEPDKCVEESVASESASTESSVPLVYTSDIGDKLDEVVRALNDVVSSIDKLADLLHEMASRQDKVDTVLEQLINIGLHLYASVEDPQPRTFFNTSFESMAHLDTAPAEPTDDPFVEEPPQEEVKPEREGKRAPVVPKLRSTLKT